MPQAAAAGVASYEFRLNCCLVLQSDLAPSPGWPPEPSLWHHTRACTLRREKPEMRPQWVTLNLDDYLGESTGCQGQTQSCRSRNPCAEVDGE